MQDNFEPISFLCYIKHMGRNKTFCREDILKKASQLFWKKGFVDTSLSDLEKATGVNKSGLYSEFKDKEDIFLESIRFYKENNPAYGFLQREPLGWDNIADFLKSNTTCSGQKGCFLSNTLREYSIIPQKVRNYLDQNSSVMNELVLKNVEAVSKNKNPEMLSKMILTFASGLSLKLNVLKPEQVVDEIDEIDEIDEFLKLIRSY